MQLLCGRTIYSGSDSFTFGTLHYLIVQTSNMLKVTIFTRKGSYPFFGMLLRECSVMGSFDNSVPMTSLPAMQTIGPNTPYGLDSFQFTVNMEDVMMGSQTT